MTITPSPTEAHSMHTARRSAQGNALVVTLIMIVLVISLLGLASEQQSGNQSLQQLDAQRHRAQFAAESFIALLEGKLRAKAVNNTAGLKTNLDDVDERANWFNLVGFDAGGAPGGTATSAIYLDGCALRWRLEPVKIMATSNTPVTDPDAKFFVNSERDTTLQAARRAAADPSGGHLLNDEAQHFHFRVVVEAYALKEPQDTISLPWTDAGIGSYAAKAQAMRVVQFEDINAFRYMFNYTANDNGGDLEVIADSEVTILKGGLHTNQRMFFSGANPVTIGPSSGDYANVEAADGIFAMGKRELYSAGQTNAFASEVAGLGTTTSIILDGKPLTAATDSRPTGLVEPPAANAQVPAVKDGIGAGIRALEEDLSTYQAWNGSFLGASQRYGIGTRIYQFADGTVTVRANGNPWHPSASPTPNDPYEHPTLLTSPPAYATDLPLFWFPFQDANGRLTKRFSDVWPLLPGAPGAPATITFQGLTFNANYLAPSAAQVALVEPSSGLLLPPPRPKDTNPPTAREYPQPYLITQGYFSAAIGENSTGTTGLVIRERGRSLSTASPRPGIGGAPALPGDTEESRNPTTDLLAYNNWLRDNYVVYLGRWLKTGAITGTSAGTIDGWVTADITQEFFDFSISSAAGLPGPNTLRDLMLHEDVFTNQREQAWFAAHGQAGTLANVLTLNLAKVQAFLSKQVDATTQLDATKHYAQYFNGYIYLERNPRYLLDIPTATPYADPLAARGSDGVSDPFGWGGRSLNNAGAIPLVALPPVVGRIDDGANPLFVRGQPQSQWTTYPNQRGVRIDRATNAGFVGAKSVKFTLVTPNTCYLWGDFNTNGGNNPLACAVYADSLIALSNAWKDDASADPMPVASNTTYQGAFVTHNIPTDRQNAGYGGSGGVLNTLRLLEDWSGKTLKLFGAVVVPGRSDFTRSPINGEDGTTTYSRSPIYDLQYNPTLLAGGASQPVGAPKQTYSKRVLSNVIGTAH